MSASAAVIIPAATGALIQILQAWIALSRMSGMDADGIQKLFDAELAEFNANTPDKLPDA